MEPGIIIAVIALAGTIGAGFIAARGRSKDRVSEDFTSLNNALTKRLDGMQKTIDDQQKTIEALRAAMDTIRGDRDEDRRTINRLEGERHDLEEVVADMVPILLWVREGKAPPDPVFSWRIKDYLDKWQEKEAASHG